MGVNQQTILLRQVHVNKSPSRSLNKDKPVLSVPKSKLAVKSRRKKLPSSNTDTSTTTDVKKKILPFPFALL